MEPKDFSTTYSIVSKFRHEEKYCDVTIQVDDKVFKGHRLWLAAMSTYFDAMFDGNFKEKNVNPDEPIDLGGIDACTFKNIIEFMYTGVIDVRDENVYSLLQANDYLGLRVNDIEEQCVRYLRERVKSPEPIPRALEILELACLMKTNLVQVMSAHIFQHLRYFLKSVSFMYISFDALDGILKCRDYFVHRHEDIILDAIIRWVDHDRKGRKNYRQNLLMFVNAENLSSGYIKSLISEYEYFKDSVSNVDATLSTTNHDERSLHVYIQNIPCCDVRRERVFSMIESDDWSLSYEFDSITEFKRSIVLSNTLYCLSYEQGAGSIFSTRNSVFSPPTVYLKKPPLLREQFNICGVQNNIYLYNDAKDHLFGSVHVYNSPLNKWLSVCCPRERLMNTASMITESRLLYLIGKETLENAQVYDIRTKRWHLMTSANNDTSKIYVNGDCCVHQGNIYAANIDHEGCIDVHVYEPTAGKWRKNSSLNVGDSFKDGLQLLSISCKNIQNELWIISTGLNIDVEIYDADSGTSHSFITLKDVISRADKSLSSLSYFLDAVIF